MSQDHTRESSGEDTSRSGLVKVWSTLESSGEDLPTDTHSEVHSSLESGEGTSTCSQPQFRSIITPPETVTWSTAQLAPFVQRLAPGQSTKGKVPFLPVVHVCSEVMTKRHDQTNVNELKRSVKSYLNRPIYDRIIKFNVRDSYLPLYFLSFFGISISCNN